MALAEVQYVSVLPEVAAELVAYRKEAVERRQASSIEQKWTYAEDAYGAEDEVTGRRSRVYKPSSPDGPFIYTTPVSWQRSTAFYNITRPYVDAAAARAADILFPTDDRNFELGPTPKLDVEDKLTNLSALPDEAVQLMMRQVQAQVESTIDAVAEAQRQIDDWLVESNFFAIGRDCLADSARVGTGVIKGPVPMLIKGRIQPGSKIVKVQNCYPDPNCGDNIHNGSYFFEREDITARLLREKIAMAEAGWLPASILSCLQEGPKSYNGVALEENGRPKQSYELWHFQGEVSVEALIESGSRPQEDAGPKMWAHVTLCNDSIVRMSVAPLQNRFTYDMMRWQKRHKHWAGIGVAEQLETIQRGMNAAVRNLFDNAALSALPQIVFWDGILTPVNQRMEIEPGKMWRVADEERPLNEVKSAIMAIEIPSRQPELMAIAEMMRSGAQEVTGLPLIAQGQAATGAVGSDQLQINAANTVHRRLAKDYDNDITEPHITAYYEWLKEFGPTPTPEATVRARGSSVLVERDIQAQALIQMVQVSANPIYGIDPELITQEWLRTQRLDPKKVALSPERREQLTQLLNQPDEKAQAQVESTQIRAQALTNQAQTEAETDRAELLLKQADSERQREHDKVMLDLKYRYEVIKYAQERNIDVAAAVAELEQVRTPGEKTKAS